MRKENYLQKSKIELTENQSMEFIFGNEKIVVVIENNVDIEKDFMYSQNGREGKLTLYNIVEKRIGTFIPVIKFEEKNIIFDYTIEKKEDKYIMEYSWSINEIKNIRVRKKSFFEKIFGSSKNLPIYIAGFITLILIANVIVLMFMKRIEYEKFWALSTHIITCCLGYLFGSKITEDSFPKEEQNLF